MFWKDRTIFLTGASSGIGEALASAMAERGAVLGLAARREDLLNHLAERCEKAGGTARVFVCDVVDAVGVRAAADAFRDEFDRIDIMIANAGVGGSTKADHLDPEVVKGVLAINFLGAVNAVNAALPEMVDRGTGHLVAISSLAGSRGLPRSAAYSASKGAMNNFFESIRLDYARKGIDVSIIQPGFIKTPLTAGRGNKMPYLMELDDAIPHFISAIENKKKFSAFPWQLAVLVRIGRIFPAWLYDRIASGATYRT